MPNQNISEMVFLTDCHILTSHLAGAYSTGLQRQFFLFTHLPSTLSVETVETETESTDPHSIPAAVAPSCSRHTSGKLVDHAVKLTCDVISI